MKPHIKVIQRNGVDIFVTSSMKDKRTVSEKRVLGAHQWNSTIDYGHNHPVWQGINNPIKKIKPRRRCRGGDEIFSIKYQPYFLPLRHRGCN